VPIFWAARAGAIDVLPTTTGPVSGYWRARYILILAA
jgi:hypothetical protein